MKNKVVVVVPAYNEELYLGATLDALKKALPEAEIVVVDNNSSDRTANIALEHDVPVLKEFRKGKGYAVDSGVSWALAQGADWVALHDADNEYCAQDLAALVEACQKEPLDANEALMGVGLREVALSKVHGRSILANWGARWALRVALGKPPPLDILTGTRVFNIAAAKAILSNARPLKGFELETAVTRRALKAGSRFVYCPVRYTPRALGEKKITPWDMLPIFKAAFTA